MRLWRVYTYPITALMRPKITGTTRHCNKSTTTRSSRSTTHTFTRINPALKKKSKNRTVSAQLRWRYSRVTWYLVLRKRRFQLWMPRGSCGITKRTPENGSEGRCSCSNGKEDRPLPVAARASLHAVKQLSSIMQFNPNVVAGGRQPSPITPTCQRLRFTDNPHLSKVFHEPSRRALSSSSSSWEYPLPTCSQQHEGGSNVGGRVCRERFTFFAHTSATDHFPGGLL